MALLHVWLLACLIGVPLVRSYYVPGTYPQEFLVGETLQAHVNSLTSFETELPYEYYTMPFCKPPEGVKRIADAANLGTVLMGVRIENSMYNFTMMKKEVGKKTCTYTPLTKDEAAVLQHKIDNRYRVRMILDNLPVTMYDLQDEDQEFVSPGVELGFKDEDKYYIYNHLAFNILVHPTHGEYSRARAAYRDAAMLENIDARRLLASGRRLLLSGSDLETLRRRLHEEDDKEEAKKEEAEKKKEAAEKKKEEAEEAAEGEPKALPADVAAAVAAGEEVDKSQLPPDTTMYMVVGFEVSPCSIKRKKGAAIENVSCEGDSLPEPQEVVEGAEITYTYDTYFTVSATRWASRWDAYLRLPGGRVHWFSILNSLLMVLVMATLVALILIRTIRRDLARYEQLVVDESAADAKEEAGWKLLTGDVFRPPANSKQLCVHVGSGVQVICVATVSLVLATLGFLSPASRGALVTTTMVLYVLLAFVAGWAAVVLWGTIERSYEGWVGVALHVSLFYPGVNMAIFTVLNLFIHHTGSSGAVPLGMYAALVAIWFLVSIPLTFLGGYVATRVPIITWPVKTNQIPRHIPPPPVVAHPILLFFSAGILPFGTIFIELYFAMNSVWQGFFYYLFGFVLVIGALALVINAEIAVLCTYVQLCAEDYLWWWRSFHRGGSVAAYVALYSLGFLAATLHSLAGFLPVLVYLAYMAIMILGLYFAMGAVGFIASLVFTHAIMAAVKQD